MGSSFFASLWRRPLVRTSKGSGRLRRHGGRIVSAEPLEPRQLLATYTWEPKNSGGSYSGWFSTNTGDYLQGSFQYPNNNQWTAPQHLSESVFASPPLRVLTGIGPGDPRYDPSYEIPGPAVIDQPGNWSLPDYPDASNADVVIGAGSSVTLSGSVNFPYAGSPPLSGDIDVGTLDNAGDLLIHSTGSLTVHGTSFHDDGTITVNSRIVFANDAATPIAGSGTIILAGGALLRPDQGQGTTSQAATHSIRGSGQILVPLTANAGLISADAGGTLTLDVGAGSLANTGTLEASPGGGVSESVLALSNGTIVNTGGTIRAAGDATRVAISGVTLVGGTLATSGTGVVRVASGTFDATTSGITNQGAIDVDAAGTGSLVWKGAIDNRGLLSVRNGKLVVEAGSSIGGGGTIALGGGTLRLAGSGVWTDADNGISGYGTISGDDGTSLSLTASLTASGDVLTVAVPVVLNGTALAAVDGGGLQLLKSPTGTGSITASGGLLTGVYLGDGVKISSGVSLATSQSAYFVVGQGAVALDGSADPLQTSADMLFESQSTLKLVGAIQNSGGFYVGLNSISLTGDTSLTGGGKVSLSSTSTPSYGAIGGTGTLTNTDNTISGTGRIGQGLTAVVNAGTINVVRTAATGNTMTFLAPVTNTGTIDTNQFGVLSLDAGLTNQGTVSAYSVSSQAAVTNAVGGSFTVSGGVPDIRGTFTNNGLLATAQLAAQSQPMFATLAHGTNGVQVAGAGDVITVGGDFLNASTQAFSWNTAGATLSFLSNAASVTHRFQLAGLDLGSAAAGWQTNFAWGGLAIKAGHAVSLESGRSDSNAAAGYVGTLAGAVIDAGTQSITNISGNGLNLYYDGGASGNAYLGGKSYALQGGGFLVPKGALGFPTGVVVANGSGQASLSWAAPALPGSGGVTDYLIQVSRDNGSTWTTFNDGTSTATSTTVTGLVNGTSYRFRVAAKYAAGTSEYSVPSAAVVIGVPNAPAGVSAFPGNGRATVAWTAPAQNAAAITGYVIEYKATGESGSTSSDGAVTNGTVFGLTNGTPYTFRVAVKNSFGTGPFSAYTDAIAPTTQPYAPTAPRSVAGTAGDAQVILAWSPPLIDGNATITDYVVQYGTNGTDWTTFDDGTSAGTLAIVNGLANGTAYAFRVAATNSAGTGAFSAASAAVTPVKPATAPGLPQSLVATLANGQVSLSWSAPASDGGSVVTDYVVRYLGPNGPVVVNDGISTATSTTVGGLTNGATYFFSVAAVNAIGQSAFTGTVSAIPRTVPAAPTAVAGTPAGGRVSLAWVAPASDGGAMISDYRIEYSSNNGSSWAPFVHVASPATFATVTGLTDGNSYVFRVAAVNAAGTGDFSTKSTAVVPKAVPGIPLDVVGTPGPGQVSLDWTDPLDPGASAITDYRIEYSSNNGATWTTVKDPVSSSSAGVVSGLTNGTAYIFRVAAINALGTGGYSPWSLPTTPRTVPNAPTALTVAAGNKQVALSWSPPAVTGGVAITDYVVQSSIDNGTNWTTFDDGTSSTAGAVVTGLTNGTAYVFRIAAVNAAGPGVFTAKSSAVTPRDVPGVPTGVSATPDNGRVALMWSAPQEQGAAAVTDYAIQFSANAGRTWTTFKDAVSSATSASVTGLNNGSSYVFRVAALNTLGSGLFSAASPAVTPRTVPNAPTGVKATAGDGLVSLAWSAPAVTGGASVVDYVVQYSSDAGKNWQTFSDGTSSTPSAVVGGLVNNTPYVFRVAAVNVAGQGASSANSAAATPRLLPGPPPAPVGVAGNGQVNLSWTAPAAPGQTITDYAVQVSADNGVTWKDYADGKAATPGATVKGLTNGTAYRFRVAGMTSAGTGTYSAASAPATPKTTPGAPTKPTGTLVGGVPVLVWTAPASNGGAAITGYAVQYSSDNGKTWASIPGGFVPSTTATVGGLANGTSYVFRVAAVNEAGTGGFSPVSAALTPKAPIDPSVYQGTYAGSFTGAKAFGTINATISGTAISVTISVTAPGTQIVNAPGTGSGTIASDGSFSFAAQGAIFGATYVGQIAVGPDGQVTANGTWKYSTIASGTWQVSRVSDVVVGT